eukprot:6086628-Ditylum_brightwellii.AAC.1
MEGTQGMVYKITEELPNAQEEITSAISIVLVNYVDAQHLCHELLINSVPAKVSARDIRDIHDPFYTCAQYIWATLKVHAVMA